MQEAPQPVGMKAAPEGSGGDRCPFCLSREFKRSRLHLGDVFTLLRMRVPARCARCGQLQTIGFKTAKGALPPGSQNETAQALSSSGSHAIAAKKQGLEPQEDSRAAIPHGVLLDALDIRCQYCPGQTFRRSRLRARGLFLILRMRYSVRCLRCGQRQTVNFMVAATAVPSNVKQARSLRNAETWKEFTANSAPALAPMMELTKPLPAVVSQVYALKDAPFEEKPARVAAEEPGVKAKTETKSDQSIW